MSDYPPLEYGMPSNYRTGGSRVFADPFRTYSNIFTPRTVAEMLRWSEGLWLKNGTYARALKRVVSYFITRVEVSKVGPRERHRYEKFLNEEINIPVTLMLLGTDFMCYGNSFSSLYVPFYRFLSCPECKGDVNIEVLDGYKFSTKECKIEWECPKCKKKHMSKPIDRRVTNFTDVKIRRWSPHEIRVLGHPVSGDCVYLWDPNPLLKKKVMEGDPFYLRYTPWEMIEAISQKKMFEFDKGAIFHMIEESLSGIRTGGWGVPQVLNTFGTLYHVALAKMYNETLLNEYIIPFRVVSPSKSGGNTGDPLQTASVGSYNARLLAMLQKHRRQPGGYHAVPFPIEYQALGGEGMQLTTHEHIAAATDELLNAAGVPAELYKGTLQFQAYPTALRLFQQTWPHLVSQMNGWLRWLGDTMSQNFNWAKADIRLQPVTLADDLEKRNIMLQLLAGNRISADTALQPLGVNYREELEKIMGEQKATMEAQQEFEQDMQNKQTMQDAMSGQGGEQSQGGAPAGGGAPSGGLDTSTAGMTPGDMLQQAADMAQKLLSMQYEQRAPEMRKLKSSNPTLHALVKAEMENLRSQASSQGGQQALQSMVGAGGAGGSPAGAG